MKTRCMMIVVLAAALARAEFVEVQAMPDTASRGLKVWSETRAAEVGNYDVSVTVGGAHAATSWIKFEGRRLAFEKVATAAGERKAVTFTARVKGEIAKPGVNTARESPYPHALNLTVVTDGEKPFCTMTPNAAARVVYLCGDSTVTDQQREPWGSWGQALPLFFRDGVAVANFARSGLRTDTFRQQGRMDKIVVGLKPGDVVVLQFGHNDQKVPHLAPDAGGGYERELNGFIDRIAAKGAVPVLVTPVERLRFDWKTKRQAGKTLAGYAEAVKRVGAARGVAVVDLNDASYRMYGALGCEGSPALFALTDKTHHSIYGAYEMARFVACGLADAVPGLRPFVREPYLGMNPDVPDANPDIPPTGAVDTTRPEGDVGKATVKNVGGREAVEAAEVSFRLTDDVLGYTRRDGRRVCDKGEYRLWIASDSNVDGEEGVVYEH